MLPIARIALRFPTARPLYIFRRDPGAGDLTMGLLDSIIGNGALLPLVSVSVSL